MSDNRAADKPAHKLSTNFWLLWTGQAISALGSSFTGFALPLLVYNLTGSVIYLAYATAAHFIPYLLFGLFIGAWSDRTDRKRLMIWTDVGRALGIASVPLLATLGMLEVWWIFVVLFVNSLFSIAFDAAKFAAVASLVDKDELVTANGRIQASYSTMTILGPLAAGVLVAVIPIYDLLVIDAMSYVVSTASLVMITAAFNAPGKPRGTSIRQDVVEGLRYVFGHPVLRNISIMMALVNFAGTTVYAQRVLYAKEQLSASDSEVALLAAAGSFGVIVLSLIAGKLRKRLPFSKVALGALMASGLATIGLAFTTWYWLGLVIWSVFSGLGIMFNINTNSLRQAIAPNHMLGRVVTIAGVLAWSANPLGAFVGGWLIERTQNVGLVYGGIGVLTVLIPVLFAFGPLGHAERYLPQNNPDEQPASQPPPEPEPRQEQIVQVAAEENEADRPREKVGSGH
ncbi:MAG TPA: MFS transporter [Chloroflexia bacterium]|nr:MFS transporter [Chloroflexia bacterium]